MQRIQMRLVAGLVLGLLMSLAAPAQAQVFYVQSSNFQTVPVSKSVVVTRSFSRSHYFNSFGYSRLNSFGYSQAWNNRTSAPPVYFQASYSPESSDYFPAISSQAAAASLLVVSSPRITREEIERRPGHDEYEQTGKFEAFDGRRIKTYRYEYEVDQRPGRTKYKFDIDD